MILKVTTLLDKAKQGKTTVSFIFKAYFNTVLYTKHDELAKASITTTNKMRLH